MVGCGLSYDERKKRRDDEQNGNNNTGVKQCFLKSAFGVEATAEVVTERAPESRSRLLEQNNDYQQD